MEVAVRGAAPLTEGACRVVAEAGANHNNSVDRAIELAQRAAAAGAWAIKFQLYKADTIAVPDSPKYWDDDIGTATQYEAFKLSDHLDYGAYKDIAGACRDLGIVFFATPFDLPGVEALETIDVPLYKIASADITYKALLEAVGQTGKPVLLSTGASEADEIEQALEWLGLGSDRVVPLVCTLTYPTPDADGHFTRIEAFRQRFSPHLVGVSDHTLGVAGGWMAGALGAVCIEKHYTLDKSLPDVPDHSMSVDPDELAQLVEACDRAVVLRGQPEIAVRESELPARTNARRSLVAERDLPSGHVIEPGDLGCKRPGTGLPPVHADGLIGRRLTRSIPQGAQLAPDDVA